jgi:polyisoprenoid-binding protein YceI
MNRNTTIVGAIVLVVLVGLGIWGYNRVLGEPEAASGPITAIPLATTAPAPAPTTVAEPTPAAEAASATPAAEAAAPTAAPAAEQPAPSSDQQLRFQIVPEESEARFSIFEELRGQPVTVVGMTNQVVGELAITPGDLSQIQLGTVQVNARTLETDSSQRNRAINNFILNTGDHEFITFKPTAINGLSGAGAVGEDYSFEIAGDLTIRDVTKPVVFTASVSAPSEDRVVGSATTVIKRSDYNLQIPSVPFVANVGEDVTIEIDFVAAPAE